MTSLGLTFRRILKFSKLKKFTTGFNNYSTTSITKKDIHGKDLYPWKYGTSYYEAQDYSEKIKITDENSCLKNKKMFGENNGLPQITNTTEGTDNIQGFDNRVDYDDENIWTEKWDSRED